jgi:hypothetical protein
MGVIFITAGERSVACGLRKPGVPAFGRGTASSGLSWQAVPANKGANAGAACVDSGGQGRTLSEQLELW